VFADDLRVLNSYCTHTRVHNVHERERERERDREKDKERESERERERGRTHTKFRCY